MRLRLAARMAASRFAASRRGKSAAASHPAWRPLALRWRRSRKPAATDRVAGTAAPAAATAAWLAHVHLHFQTLASDRVRRESPSRLSSAAVTRQVQRVFLRHSSTVVRTAAAPMQPRVASRAAQGFPVRTAAAKASASAAAAGPARVRPMHLPLVPRVAARRRHPLVEPARSIVCVRTSSGERPRTFEPRAPLVPREPRVFRRSAAPTPSAAARRSHEEITVSQLRIVRTPELVWRRAPQPRTEPGEERVMASQPSSVPRSAVRAAAAQEAAAEELRRAARPKLQAADLDPGLLDRLTDDVIRRVERRVRIERERRGL